INFQNGHSAAHIDQNLTRWILFAAKVDAEVSRFSAHRVGGVKSAGGIDKKPGPKNFAVLVNAVNFHYGFFGTVKNLFYLFKLFYLRADGAGRWFLRPAPLGGRAQNQGDSDPFETHCQIASLEKTRRFPRT